MRVLWPEDWKGWGLLVSATINVALIVVAFALYLGSSGSQIVDGEPNPAQPTIWVAVLILFGISGAAGGILAALQLTDLPELMKSSELRMSRVRAANITLALAISAAGGIGGAGAALF